MSVNESNITEGGKWITLAATPEDKLLLKAIAKQNGDTSESAMVRLLIRQEAVRRGISITQTQPA